jgi:hypothetical protein
VKLKIFGDIFILVTLSEGISGISTIVSDKRKKLVEDAGQRRMHAQSSGV